MDIKCKKTTCKFNKDYSCLVKNLEINKQNTCSSFVQAENKKEDKTRKIFYEKVTYAPFTNAKTKNITCVADCIFAKDDKCFANGITLSPCASGTCITHKKELEKK